METEKNKDKSSNYDSNITCVDVRYFKFLLNILDFKVGLGISHTNADSQWNPVY